MVIEEHAALDVITKDGSTYAIDESQIIRGSLTTSQSCSSGGGIPAGSCNTGTASVAFHATSALSYEKLFGAKVKLYVWYGDTSKKQVGVYNVTSTERSYGVYTLSLSDNVYLLDEACYSNDTTTAAQNWLAMQLGEKRVPSVIFNMICNAYSVPHWNAAKNEEAVPESGISALSVKVPSDCCTESVKDFANYLAEYLGAIIMPDENGYLHFAYMGSRTCPITIDASNIERGTYQKAPFHVSTSSWRVNHDSGIWTSWSVSGDFPDNAAPLSIVVNNNPFWQSVEDGTPGSMVRGRTETMLRYMWVAQGKVAYIDNVPQINPFRCTVHVPYYFRAGDRVKIIDPITSEVYHSYVTDVTWTFRGGQQISCAGEDTRTLSVSTSRNGAKKMSDYSRYLYRKSKSNTGSVEANTYTKAEIDAKDAAVKSAADKAQGTADGAVSVNNTQNTKIAALQKSAHTHSNKGVLDKIEQPYTTAERDKLAGLENYTHPTHTAHTKGFYKFANDGLGHVSDAEKVTKDDIVDLGIPGSIPIYNVDVDEEYGHSEGMIIATIVVNQTAHPIGVPIIGENENADYGLMSASDKKKLDGISDNANNYVHPTTSGNKHIPAGGSSGQILRWSADGTAVWGADNNTTYSDATQSTHGLMTAADKKKLDGIAAGAEVNQNAFSTIATGSARYAATAKQSAFLIDGDGGTSVSLDTKTGRLTVSSHTHDNKDVLDQITQTEWNAINSAKNKAHTHDNKKTLDKIDDVSWLTVYGQTHEHSNKAVLDKLTVQDYSDFKGTVNKAHVHSNKSTLDKIDETSWLLVYGQTHVHENQSVLDKTTASYTAAEKTKLDGIASGANKYVHPTTSGNKHIPSGGSSGQILRWSADGTAVWGADNNTTYNDATQSTHGLMTAADKKKLDGMDLTKYLPLAGGVMNGDIDMQTNKKDILVGTHKANTSDGTAVASGIIEKRANMKSTLPEMRSFIGSFHNTDIDRFYSLISVRHRNGYTDGNVFGMYIFSDLTSAGGNLKWGKQTAAKKWTDDFVLLDSRNFTSYAAKSDHTHAMITNSAMWIAGANNAAKWYRLGVLVSSGDFSNAVIRVWSGDGANGRANQNSSFEVQIKDGLQSTESATKACAVTVYRINCSSVKVKVIPTAHDTYTVWVYLPWTYWNGNYAVYGKYKSWTSQKLIQSDEPEGTAADIAYYDQAFLTSTVAAANTLTDSGWIATTRSTTFTVTSTVKCRKYGQLVEVRGDVTFSDTCGSPTVCTLPAGYRPATVVQACGITPNGKQYMIKADTSGVISFGSDSGSTFVKGTTYRVDLTYLLG